MAAEMKLLILGVLLVLIDNVENQVTDTSPTSVAQPVFDSTVTGSTAREESAEESSAMTDTPLTPAVDNSSDSKGPGDSTTPAVDDSSESKGQEDSTTPAVMHSSDSNSPGDSTTPAVDDSSDTKGQGDSTTPAVKDSSDTKGQGDSTTSAVKDSTDSKGQGDSTTTPVMGCFQYTISCNTTDCASPTNAPVVSCNFQNKKACLISEAKKGNSTTLTASCVDASCEDELMSSEANGSVNKKCCTTTRCNTKSVLHAGSPRMTGLIPLILVTLGVTSMLV